jgi:hypothetical protein
MQIKMRSFFLLVMFLAIKTILAQNHIAGSDHSDHNHDHYHAKNEIGVANSLVYLINEKATAYGLHLHYIRNIKHSGFGIGMGYERIFDEHKHNTIGPALKYEPVKRLSLIFSPGIMVEDDHLNEPNLALHFETAYELELKSFLIGPAFEFAWSTGDLHFSLGLHLGFAF